MFQPLFRETFTKPISPDEEDDEVMCLDPDDFTLPGVIRSCVSTGYVREAIQPETIKLSMLHYQRQSLAWMQDMENAPRGLNSFLWEERTWIGGERFFFFPMAGELRIDPPPLVTGGILSEEMGMGKTLEVLALIASEKEAREATIRRRLEQQRLDKGKGVAAERGGGMMRMRDEVPPGLGSFGFVGTAFERIDKDDLLEYADSTTLIVVPLTLLSQWVHEVSKCCSPPLPCMVFGTEWVDHMKVRNDRAHRFARHDLSH